MVDTIVNNVIETMVDTIINNVIDTISDIIVTSNLNNNILFNNWGEVYIVNRSGYFIWWVSGGKCLSVYVSVRCLFLFTC